MPNGEFRFEQQRRALIGDAVAVGVAQQRDAIGARHRGPRALHRLLHEEALDALAVLGPLGRRGFGDQHVAVRQHVQPARMIEPVGERDDLRCPGRDRAARRCASRSRVRCLRRESAISRAPASSGSGPMPCSTCSLASLPQARAGRAQRRAPATFYDSCAWLATLFRPLPHSVCQRAPLTGQETIVLRARSAARATRPTACYRLHSRDGEVTGEAQVTVSVTPRDA